MACFILRAAGAAGFSLIEVLVALVIGGLALSAVAGALDSGLVALRVGGQADTALTLAEAKLAGAGSVEPLRPGAQSGEFAGTYRWQLTITPFRDPHEDSTADADPLTALQLYRVAVVVGWRDGWRERQLTLSSVRLGSAP